MSEPPLSILHVLAPADVGGLETVVRTIAAGLADRGHDVAIAAVLDRATNPFVDEARATGLRVHVLNCPARSFLPERRQVRMLLESCSVDILHSHGYRSDILDIGIARSMRIPSVTTLHGFAATDAKARAYEWLQLRAAQRASAIVAVSSNVARRVIASGAAPSSVHLIRNAATPVSSHLERVEAREILGLDDGFQIGWVGRLSAEKGPDIMLESMSGLAALPVTLSFIGDGPDRSALVARAQQSGVAAQVRFHGRVTDAARLLRAFDVIALTSRTEGTPMIILEAMGAGVPIVATRVGGIPDMLSDKEAQLVDPEKPEQLGRGIRDALIDPLASAARARNAEVRLASQFDTGAWLAQYESLYRSIQPGFAGDPA